MDKYIGRLLDNRYEILEVIGTGGMAVVYKARCHRLNRLVAIKILKDDFLGDEDFRSRFHSESQAVAMLSHPNIVSVYDVSTSVTADYIVMELIEGITLKQYMQKRQTLNWKETLHFAIQIAKALEHAHSRGIVHRDIKPHNIMVLKNGSVKVTDFGIARMKSKGNTLTKEALGSVHYISPEQAKGGRVDDRSDLYSLGVVMYEMMAGRPPYDGDSPVAVAIQHINGGAVMPSLLNPNIPGGLEQIIMKAMAHDPADRFASATKMLADMDEFRKDPAMLFDYNTPPLDAVTRLQRPQPKAEPPVRKTTAERVAKRSEAGGHSSASASNVRKTGASGKKPEKGQDQSRAAVIAIIVCSLVALIALIAFIAVFASGGASRNRLYEVPDLAGEVYDNLPVYTQFQIKSSEVYDDTVEVGVIVDQRPEAGEKISQGETIFVTVSKGKAPKETKQLLDLTGMRDTDAINHLNSLSLNLDIQTKEENHEEYTIGTVIRTEPGAGEELEVGQTVYLVISIGPQIRSGFMPDVTGKTKDVAIRTLDSQDLKLNISSDEEFSSAVAVGEIIRTEPAAGSELKTGQAVKLYVSKGPRMEKMPNVVDSLLARALEDIRAQGFIASPTITYVDNDKPEGTVLKQYPEKYAEVSVDTAISLEVSRGPKPTQPTEPTVTKDAYFLLPDDYVPENGASTYKVEIYLEGNTKPIATITANVGDPSVTVELTGKGVQKYQLYVDGEFDSEQKVEFTANG